MATQTNKTRESFYFAEEAQEEAQYLAEKINGYIAHEKQSCDNFDCPAELDNWSGEIDAYCVYNEDNECVAEFAYWTTKQSDKDMLIEYLTGESESGNSILSATTGQGGAGLDFSVWSTEQIEELKNYELVAVNCKPCIDIEESEKYQENARIYEFVIDNECIDNPTKLQIVELG